MSKRQDIINGFTSCLNASTSINFATNENRSWENYEAGQFPMVTVLDGPTNIERLAYPDTSNEDMQAEMSVIVRGAVLQTGGAPASNYYSLLEEVEKKVYSSTTLAVQAKEWYPVSIEPDNAVMDNYRIFEATYQVLYMYNHLSP